MGAPEAVDELPPGFEPDAPPDGFELDAKPDATTHIGPAPLSAAEQARYASGIPQRAMAALEKLKRARDLPRPKDAKGLPPTLEPDEADALRHMLRGGSLPNTGALDDFIDAERDLPRHLAGAAHAANAATLNTGPTLYGVGHAVGSKIVGDQRPFSSLVKEGAAPIRGYLRETREKYPWTSGVGGGAGALATSMFGGGLVGLAVQGAVAGAASTEPNFEASDVVPALEGGALGAGSALGLGAAMKYGPGLAGAAIDHTKLGAGIGMQRLARLLGVAKHEAGPGAEAAEREAIGASLAKDSGKPALELDDWRPDAVTKTTANPASEAVTKTASAPLPTPVGGDTGRLMISELQRIAADDPAGLARPAASMTEDELMAAVNAKAAQNIPGAAQIQAAHPPNVDEQALSQIMGRVGEQDAARFAEQPTNTASGQFARSKTGAGTVKLKPEAAASEQQAVAPWESEDKPGSLLRDRQPRPPSDADKPAWWSSHYKSFESPDLAAEARGDAELGLARARDRQGWDVDSRVAQPSKSGMLPEALDEAALSSLAGKPAPNAPRSANSIRFGTKRDGWEAIKEAGGVDDYDASRGDAAYQAWKQGGGPRPPPFEGGHFDAINAELGLAPGRGVSGGREAFDLLTRGEKNWDQINTAIRHLRGVPGLEKLRLPDAVQEAVLPAPRPNTEPSFNFGANARDPKNGQRGMISIDLLDAMGLMGAGKATKFAVKHWAPAMDRFGRSLEESARQSLAPGEAVRRAASDPSVLMSLLSHPGVVGGTARAIMQALQQGNQQDVKAKAAVLEMLPEFRAQFAPGKDGQDRAGTGASGY